MSPSSWWEWHPGTLTKGVTLSPWDLRGGTALGGGALFVSSPSDGLQVCRGCGLWGRRSLRAEGGVAGGGAWTLASALGARGGPRKRQQEALRQLTQAGSPRGWWVGRNDAQAAGSKGTQGVQGSVYKAPGPPGTHPGVSTLRPALRAPYRPGLQRGDPITPAIQDVSSQRLTHAYSFFLTKRKNNESSSSKVLRASAK